MPQTSSPLLQGQGLPEFGAITCDRVKQDIPVILKQVDEAFTAYERRLEDILGSQTNLDWSTVMGPTAGVWGASSVELGCCLPSQWRVQFIRTPRSPRGTTTRGRSAW
jgi:hypothetical protein